MISGALDYFRGIMNTLGFNEWTDALNFENIPNSLLDGYYHLELGEVTTQSTHDNNIHLNVPITLRSFIKGFVDTGAGRDSAAQRADTIIDQSIKAANRLNDTYVKNISFDSVSIEPIATSNDNIFIVKINFSALIIKSTT